MQEMQEMLEALSNSFMVKTSENTPHTLFDFAYTCLKWHGSGMIQLCSFDIGIRL